MRTFQLTGSGQRVAKNNCIRLPVAVCISKMSVLKLSVILLGGERHVISTIVKCFNPELLNQSPAH